MKQKRDNVELALVTSFKLMNYYTGASDLSALESILSKNGIITNYQKLHSKIYIFDDITAVVTSANLTNGGLRTNYEYGILLDDKDTVEEIISDYNLLLSSEIAGNITSAEVAQAKDIISRVPKSDSIILPKLDAQKGIEELEVFTGGTASIKASLTGWKSEVFACLEEIPATEFTLSDVNKFIPQLQQAFPDNHNIEAKIRQQLQLLRDIGLVEFLGGGNYRKLWS